MRKTNKNIYKKPVQLIRVVKDIDIFEIYSILDLFYEDLNKNKGWLGGKQYLAREVF